MYFALCSTIPAQLNFGVLGTPKTASTSMGHRDGIILKLIGEAGNTK